MDSIIFFNDWHYGDIFASKGYVQRLLSLLPEDIYVSYAHPYDERLIQDLDIDFIDVKELFRPAPRVKFVEYPDILAINTWCGAYMEYMDGQPHANWIVIHKMFRLIYAEINKRFKLDLEFSENPKDHFPKTDFSSYDTEAADKFVEDKDNIILLCNGVVKSTSHENSLGDMSYVIVQLAKLHPNRDFLCTAKFTTNLKNIYFTDDIFKVRPDLSDIGYLSTLHNVKIIIGQASGPFMYCHEKTNMQQRYKMFVNLSVRPQDCYPFGLGIILCRYVHCDNILNPVLTVKALSELIDKSVSIYKGVEWIRSFA